MRMKFFLFLLGFLPACAWAQSNSARAVFIQFDNKISITPTKTNIPFSFPADHDVPTREVLFSTADSVNSVAGASSKLNCMKNMSGILNSSDLLDEQLAITFGPVYYADANWLSGQPNALEDTGWKCLEVLQKKYTNPNAVRQGTYTSYSVRTVYPASTFNHFEAMLQSLLYLTNLNPAGFSARYFGLRNVLGVYSDKGDDPCPKVGTNWVCEFRYDVRDPIAGRD